MPRPATVATSTSSRLQRHSHSYSHSRKRQRRDTTTQVRILRQPAPSGSRSRSASASEEEEEDDDDDDDYETEQEQESLPSPPRESSSFHGPRRTNRSLPAATRPAAASGSGFGSGSGSGSAAVRMTRRSSLPRRNSPGPPKQQHNMNNTNNRRVMVHPSPSRPILRRAANHHQASPHNHHASSSNNLTQPSHYSTRTHPRHQRVLSPLPTNHSIPRNNNNNNNNSISNHTNNKSNNKGKQRALAPLPATTIATRPHRAAAPAIYVSTSAHPSGSGSGSASSGSASNSLAVPGPSNNHNWSAPLDDSPRGRKRKRHVRIVETTTASDDEYEDDLGDEYELEDYVESVAQSSDDGESESSDAEVDSDSEMVDQDDQFNISEASIPQLRRLRRDDLARLLTLATGEDASSTIQMTKDSIITAIMESRIEDADNGVSEDEEEAEETVVPPESTSTDEDDSGTESVRPFTSHEGSPALESKSRKSKSKNSKRRNERRATRRHVPTPPASDAAQSDSENDDDIDSTEEDEDLNEKSTFNGKTRGIKTRSHSMPGLSARPDLRRPNGRAKSAAHLLESANPSPPAFRTRRSVKADLEGRSVRLRNGKNVVAAPSRQPRRSEELGEAEEEAEEDVHADVSDGDAVEEEEQVASEDSTASGPTPIARRTRNGTTARPPSSTTKARPAREAKKQANARLKTSNDKGKARAVSQDAESDASEDGMDQDSVADVDESEDIMDGEVELAQDDDEEMAPMSDAPPRRTRATNQEPLRRRTRRGKVQQVETPPSDADEESVGEDTDEEEEEENDLDDDHENALVEARLLRNGKVVQPTHPTVETVEEELEEEDGDLMEEDGEGDDADLTTATKKNLLRRKRDDLVRLCEERALDGDGTKKELVHALLQWREAHVDNSSGNSTASGGTARGETKTQALKAIPDSAATSCDTPLLMQDGHEPDPDKPRTAQHSKADEQEEVNALDLESLQLQDKEIAPEKLTKLEKIGSGGFKDVFKGLYRKKMIAIADIRGHLTDMDIKELGLLRDLRHTNIVHFIGVSIPKEPSSVPVMIVTELCSNGDLFDYIRSDKPTPPLRTILDIMLGISKGVEYLHTRTPSIIHRDIKSSNVLITQNGTAKINDFGLARVKTSTRSVIRSLVGTVNWQAPELWVPHPRYNEKVDVYSVGLVFWEILQWHMPVKRYPFEGMNEHAIYDAVGQKNIRPSTASLGRTWGAEILELINAMWQSDHTRRPSMAQVVAELEIIKSMTPPPSTATHKKKIT